MSIIGNPLTTGHFPVDTFSGDNSTVLFALSQNVASAASIDVHIGSVYQVPDVAYNVNGNNITFTSAPPTGTNNIVVVHKGIPIYVPTPADGSVNLSKVSGSLITSGTAIATTSGTSHDFTGIPSWVKKITVMLSGVSTNGTSAILIQLGSSGGIETTGYDGSASTIAATSVASANYTTGISLREAGDTHIREGIIEICNTDGNTWVANGTLSRSETSATVVTASSKSLAGVLDRIRLTTVGGTDTFDAGKINILYE